MKAKFVLLAALLGVLVACGPRGSGYAPAENAVTALPGDEIDLQPHDYVLPEATENFAGFSSYDTGDSSGGRVLSTSNPNAVLQAAAAGLEGHVAEAEHENEEEHGLSTTIADETSEGDRAHEDGLNDAVVQPEGEADDVMTSADDGDVSEPESDEVSADVAVDEIDEIEPDDTEATGDVEAVVEGNAEGTEESGEEETEAITEEVTEAEDETEAEDATESDNAEDETAEEAEPDTEQADGTSSEEEASTAESETEASEIEASQADEFDWQTLGETTYSTNCVACHQANGAGIPGAFPPLAGHMPELYNAEGGRQYIINVVLYGLQGQIEVDGTVYNGVMTPWSQLSDEQIAATLNHELTSWDNEALLEDFSPIQPQEVAAERGKNLTGAQVLELRPELGE